MINTKLTILAATLLLQVGCGHSILCGSLCFLNKLKRLQVCWQAGDDVTSFSKHFIMTYMSATVHDGFFGSTTMMEN